ncbi:MAG: restriction endonuclease subunit S [Candidatus Margulisbacteria bacterium]|nr:restriction endonuclease subunit S [Candidatus Margulisiibacteriota bacterium]
MELGEICEIKGGKRIPRGKTFSGVVTEYPYIRVVDFMNGTINLSKVKYISGDVFARIRKYTISQEDVYMSIAGTIGVTGTVPRELDGKSLTENAAKLVIKNKAALDKNFLAYILQNTDSQEQIKSFAKGAGIPKLALARIARIKIPLPALEIQRKLAAAAAKEREIINAGRQLIAIMKQKITNVLEESWY